MALVLGDKMTKEELKAYGMLRFSPKSLKSRHPELVEILESRYPQIPLREALWLYHHNAQPGRCLVCNKLTKFVTVHDGYKEFCSHKCSANSDKVRQKTVQTNLKRYGHQHSFCSEPIKAKIKQTNLERYGVDSPFKSEEIQHKIKQTNLERYGFEVASKSDKAKQALKEHWDNLSAEQKQQILDKRSQTNLEKFGFEVASKSKNVRLKLSSAITNKVKDGWTPQTEESKDKRRITMIRRYGVPYKIGVPKQSKPAKKFKALLEAHNIKYQEEVSIGNFRVDFVVGNVAIEINPTATHNDSFNPYNGKAKTKDYHLIKTKEYKSFGYKCIHVWDWDKFESILNLIKPKETIFARKCQIREVSKSEADEFLREHHIQGTIRAQLVRIGLYYGDNLVQIMTFGKPRYNKNYDWELLRLCSHSDFKVLGGASKILKHFRQSNEGSIISYCDKSKFDGGIYEILGFSLLKDNPPSKHWAKPYRTLNPAHFTDNFVRQKGFDNIFGTSFGKGSSNDELMRSAGFLSVWDCGQSSYVLDKQKTLDFMI